MKRPIGVMLSRVRMEEKMILSSLERRGIPYVVLDDRRLRFDPDWTLIGHESAGSSPLAAVINRSIAYTRGLYAARLLEARGMTVFNSSQVAEICGDKLQTTLALERTGLPIPRWGVAFTPESALAIIEDLGYPVVLKSIVGSWGRLLAKVNDTDAAEAILEHKTLLGSSMHGVLYIQEYIAKPNRDIRTIVIGEECVSAMYRTGSHWITNTARGSRPEPCPISDELAQLSVAAARAVGGGAVAVDLMEDATGRLRVNEVNHSLEFHGTFEATGVNIADQLVDYVLRMCPVCA